MKQTLEKRLIVDISLIRKMIERNEMQISDVLTKPGVSSSELLNVLSTSKMISL